MSVAMIATPEIPVEPHFTAQQISKRFGVSVKLVYAEQNAGRLAYVRFGSRRVVPESAIVAYIKSRAVGDHPLRPLPPPAPTLVSGRT